MLQNLSKIFSVLSKDLKSEFRTRYSLSAVFLFILTAVAILIFSLASETMSESISSGILWIIMFFSSMTGLSKSFVSEEERGTYLILSLHTSPASVYFGKLLFNALLGIIMNTFSILLFLLFVYPGRINEFEVFAVCILLGSLGISSASTIISALIAKANTKNALFPILSFPLLVPLILVGVETTKFGLSGAGKVDYLANFRLMAAYSGVVITASYLLFDYVWRE